jgi:hypothetical protein
MFVYNKIYYNKKLFFELISNPIFIISQYFYLMKSQLLTQSENKLISTNF